MLNKKYVINYEHFDKEDIENAILNILKSDIESEDQLITNRKKLVLDDDSIGVEQLSGIALNANRILKYNTFLRLFQIYLLLFSKNVLIFVDFYRFSINPRPKNQIYLEEDSGGRGFEQKQKTFFSPHPSWVRMPPPFLPFVVRRRINCSL